MSEILQIIALLCQINGTGMADTEMRQVRYHKYYTKCLQGEVNVGKLYGCIQQRSE